jgi:hypothetical protein
MIVKLSKPIEAHGASVAELDLREPTVEEVGEIGYPFLLVPGDNGGGMELRPKIIMRYASKLAGVPPSSLKGVTIGDLGAIQSVVMGFFIDVMATKQNSSTELSTLPSSTE